ncbi:MAG: 3-demethylubiquinone-9 3-methyltransferase, partial [uncultured Corynebacteriales bacterium]
VDRGAAAPTIWWRVVRPGRPSTERTHRHAEDHAVPVVRRPGRGGRDLLHVRLPQLPDHRGDPAREGRPGGGGRGADRVLLAGRPGLRRAERRPAVQLLRGRLAAGPLPVAGRGRPLLGEARRGRRGGALRLGEGPVRAVLAGRPDRAAGAGRRPGPGARGPGGRGDAPDGEDRHRRAAPGRRRRL